MKLNLSNTYSLYITISLELIDVSTQFTKEVKNYGDHYALTSGLLSQYIYYFGDIAVC